MRVLVDASAAFDQGAGIGRYARNVLSSAIVHLDGTRWTLLRFPERRGAPPFPFDEADAWRHVSKVRRTAPLTRRRADQLFFRLGLPLDARLLAGRADIVFSPDFTAPPTGNARRVITIHDLAFLTHPECAPRPLRRFLERVVPEQVRRADAVAVVSETTRRDVLERLDIESGRVHLVSNGVDARFFDPPQLTRAQRERLLLPERYLLMVGTLEPRKNHLHVFDALKALLPPLRLPLVVAGRRGWAYEPVLAAAEPLVAKGDLLLLDYVPDELLPSLYAGASALVYPSWTEGFGLPVLEGLAAGVPVVTSTAPALREVGGDVAYYADPRAPESIADAIEQAVSTVDRTRRARGQARARCYSWDRSGRQLADLLRSVNGRYAS